jgi:hypothetical protein
MSNASSASSLGVPGTSRLYPIVLFVGAVVVTLVVLCAVSLKLFAAQGRVVELEGGSHDGGAAGHGHGHGHGQGHVQCRGQGGTPTVRVYRLRVSRVTLARRGRGGSMRQARLWLFADAAARQLRADARSGAARHLILGSTLVVTDGEGAEVDAKDAFHRRAPPPDDAADGLAAPRRQQRYVWVGLKPAQHSATTVLPVDVALSIEALAAAVTVTGPSAHVALAYQ